MSFDLSSISTARALKAPRTIVAGRPKTGKSTFVSGAPGCVFIPIKGEEGIDALDVAAFPTVGTLNELIEALSAIYNGAGEHKYNQVVIDSATSLEPLIHAATCERHGADSIEQVLGGYGKGFTETLVEWRSVLQWMDALRNDHNIASTFISHVDCKQFSDPLGESYDQYVIRLHKHAAALLEQWADAVLFVDRKVYTKSEESAFSKTKTKIVGDGSAVVYTQPSPGHPAGGRWPFGNLPAEIPLDWAAYQAEVAKVVKGGQ
jgi:hypothetical protein